VHSSAEHLFLYCFWTTFLGAWSSSFGGSRFLFDLPFSRAAFTTGLLRAVTEVARFEDVRRRVEETSADESFFFLISFATVAAAASAFLSWLSL
jgi:hypothetical protein